MAMAEAAGFPPTAMGVLTSLYHKTIGTLLLQGRLYEQVALESGIRQGCPLSPLLFALASDSLLRIIHLRHPAATVRASPTTRQWSCAPGTGTTDGCLLLSECSSLSPTSH